MKVLWSSILSIALAGSATASTAPDQFEAQLAAIELGSDQRRLGEAEVALDQLRQDEQAQTPQRMARIELEAARVELRRGQFLLAEQHMLAWQQKFDTQVSEYVRVRAAIVLAQSRFEQYQLDQAEVQLRALQNSPAMGEPALRAELANALGAVQIYAGDMDAALETLASGLAFASADQQPLLRAQMLCWMGLAYLYRSDLDAAERVLSEGLQLRQTHAPDSVSVAVALYFQALVKRWRGDLLGARGDLDRAVELLDTQRLRQSSYADTRAQWAAQFAFIYRGAIISATQDQDLPRAIALLQRYRGPETALGHALDPINMLREGQAKLAVGETVLAFVTHQDHNLALVLTADSFSSFPINLDQAALREAVDALAMLIAARGAADPAALHERSHQLYRQLIAPALLLAPQTQRLLLQPDGPLHELPFAALVSRLSPQPRYLVEDLVLTRLGSLGQRPVRFTAAAAKPPVWSIADPQLQDDDENAVGWLRDGSRSRLPGAAAEASAIHDLYAPGATLLTGMSATEAMLKSAPAHADLHFATHMVRDSVDEQRSYLALRAGAGEDGQLTAAEIFAHFQGSRELVVLSGCASQRGALAGGAGALSLARAWQQAGAQRVLASQWPVPDLATAGVMTRFHSYRRVDGDVAGALAKAQRHWLQQARAPGMVESIARWWRREDGAELGLPFYWAAMVVSE